MTKEFSSLYVSRLSINDLYSLSKTTIGYASPQSENLGTVPGATLLQLESSNSAMGQQMNKASKSALTAQLQALDIDRDDRFAEIKRNVVLASKARDAVQKAAGESLKIFLAPYWQLGNRPLNTETGILKEMFAKYNDNETLKTQATTIRIDGMMSGLETANSEFDVLYQTRNAQEADKGGPSATSLKAETAKAYEQFCTAIEQAVNFAPSDSINTLFNQMNELRKTYARLSTGDDSPTPGPAQPM